MPVARRNPNPPAPILRQLERLAGPRYSGVECASGANLLQQASLQQAPLQQALENAENDVLAALPASEPCILALCTVQWHPRPCTLELCTVARGCFNSDLVIHRYYGSARAVLGQY